jgi:hypothetical protein
MVLFVFELGWYEIAIMTGDAPVPCVSDSTSGSSKPEIHLPGQKEKIISPSLKKPKKRRHT